jgi:hypothetical protein
MSKSQEQLNRTKLKKAMELPRPRGVLSGRIVALSMFGTLVVISGVVFVPVALKKASMKSQAQHQNQKRQFSRTETKDNKEDLI